MAKLTPCGGLAFSVASVAEERRPLSVSLGLWHSTHISIWFRFSPWSDRNEWQPLHLAMSTTCRRGLTGEPSTEKYFTLLMAPYSLVCSCLVPGNRVIPRRASIPIAKVPLAF